MKIVAVITEPKVVDAIRRSLARGACRDPFAERAPPAPAVGGHSWDAVERFTGAPRLPGSGAGRRSGRGFVARSGGGGEAPAGAGAGAGEFWG